jgi:hypothetical protein
MPRFAAHLPAPALAIGTGVFRAESNANENHA